MTGSHPKPGRRQIAISCGCKDFGYVPWNLWGPRYRNEGYVRPGTALTFVPSESYKQLQQYGRLIEGQFNVQGNLALIEVGSEPLDNLVKPLFKGPETFDLPNRGVAANRRQEDDVEDRKVTVT